MKGPYGIYAAVVLSVRNINRHKLLHGPPQAGHPTPPPEPHLHPAHTAPPLLFMERLIETIAKYLCRHRSVGLLRLTLDLTRRRLDLFAEIGAAEVVKGAPPTPRTDAWWQAVREAVHALHDKGLTLDDDPRGRRLILLRRRRDLSVSRLLSLSLKAFETWGGYRPSPAGLVASRFASKFMARVRTSFCPLSTTTSAGPQWST